MDRKNSQVLKTPSSLYYLRENGEIYEMIMHIGLRNFEEKSVEIVSQNGGNILEIGFGMGISADKFQYENINSYTCIEINDSIFSDAIEWSTNKNNVTLINDSWQNYLSNTTQKYDAIYCDFLDWDNHLEFYEKSKNILNNNGIISTYGGGVYFGLTDMNVEDNIIPPQTFDDDFTPLIYNRLVSKGYYKVYWQYFNGTSYVKTLN